MPTDPSDYESLQGESGPSTRGLQGLSRAAGEAILERGWTLAVAESCTAGWVMKALTDVPGSSRYLVGGVVAYADRAKVEALGVDSATLLHHGAVSEAAAREMARGVSSRFGTQVGLAVTGIAGPDGGSPEKPVGTVWMAYTGPGSARSEIGRFQGGRDAIREQAVRGALSLLLMGLSQER